VEFIKLIMHVPLSPFAAQRGRRPQRHIPNSIATVHCAMVVAIARRLPRCLMLLMHGLRDPD
jgi:hypothetical protein